MKLTEQQQKWLVFGLGMLFSFRSIPKAYAPTIVNPTGENLDPNRKCPEGQYKEGIGCTMGMDAGSLACAEESKRLGGFRCVDDNRPKSQSDCPQGQYFHYYPKSADPRQLGDEMACMPFPQQR